MSKIHENATKAVKSEYMNGSMIIVWSNISIFQSQKNKIENDFKDQRIRNPK